MARSLGLAVISETCCVSSFSHVFCQVHWEDHWDAEIGY